MPSPAQYVKKYKLKESDNFSYDDFMVDFITDFMSTVEYFRLNSNFNHSMFKHIINQMRDKWDSINNKTMGNLPEFLWKKFYATVAKPAEEQLFPEFFERLKEIKNFSDDELVEYLNNKDIGVGGFSHHFYNPPFGRYWADANNLDDPNTKYALSEYQRRFEIHQQQEEEQREKRDKEERERFNRSYFGGFDSFFHSMLGRLMNRKPSDEFQKLGLEDTATETEVNKAYKNLSKRHHPDKGGKQSKFIEITEAKNKCISFLSKVA